MPASLAILGLKAATTSGLDKLRYLHIHIYYTYILYAYEHIQFNHFNKFKIYININILFTASFIVFSSDYKSNKYLLRKFWKVQEKNSPTISTFKTEISS